MVKAFAILLVTFTLLASVQAETPTPSPSPSPSPIPKSSKFKDVCRFKWFTKKYGMFKCETGCGISGKVHARAFHDKLIQCGFKCNQPGDPFPGLQPSELEKLDDDRILCELDAEFQDEHARRQKYSCEYPPVDS
ncbi:hypothetical protein BGZ75_004352 [Mortierella antarctica]|nr:hypothetical protein BGZ75_004352 [Mortierella antarctica]